VPSVEVDDAVDAPNTGETRGKNSVFVMTRSKKVKMEAKNYEVLKFLYGAYEPKFWYW
jgi:hypothetical protein